MRKLKQYLDDLPEPQTPQEAFDQASARRTVELLDTIRGIGIACLIGLVAIGVIGVVYVRQANRTDEVQSCRSSFNAELAQGPTTAALKALSDFGVESAEYKAAADKADPEQLIELAQLSRTDTDEFLRICRSRTD